MARQRPAETPARQPESFIRLAKGLARDMARDMLEKRRNTARARRQREREEKALALGIGKKILRYCRKEGRDPEEFVAGITGKGNVNT